MCSVIHCVIIQAQGYTELNGNFRGQKAEAHMTDLQN